MAAMLQGTVADFTVFLLACLLTLGAGCNLSAARPGSAVPGERQLHTPD